MRKGWMARCLAAGRWLALGGVGAALVACGGGSGEAFGTLRLAMTDAPACGYEHVYVTVERVRVHRSADATDSDAGWREMAVTPVQRLDLLSLNNGVLQELGSMPLPAGSYQQIRLVLAPNPANPTPAAPLANALVLDDGVVGNIDPEIPLTTPSAQQSGLKLQAHFDVVGGQLADLVLDFDACRSIVKAGSSGQYLLKPVISVFRRLTTAIVGYVDASLALPSTRVAAQQNGVTVRATVPVQAVGPELGRFTIAWLPVNPSTGTASYHLVVTGAGRSTAVVTNVPVALATGTTVLNLATAPISPPASAMAFVGGQVKNGSAALLTAASVAATQSLTGGPLIELQTQAVDALDASYLMSLPLGGPVKAPFVVAGGPLVFGAADTAVAGRATRRS